MPTVTGKAKGQGWRWLVSGHSTATRLSLTDIRFRGVVHPGLERSFQFVAAIHLEGEVAFRAAEDSSAKAERELGWQFGDRLLSIRQLGGTMNNSENFGRRTGTGQHRRRLGVWMSQQQQMKLQMILDRRAKFEVALSNLLKTRHETAMNAIRNMK